MSASLATPPSSTVRHPLAYIRDSLLMLERDEHHLPRWAARHSCLAGVSSTGELINLTHRSLRNAAAPAGPGGIDLADQIFRVVVGEHLEGDPQATMTCLLMIYPLLASCVRHLEDDLAGDLVAAALAALPRVPGSSHAFALMKRAVHTELRTRTTRRPVLERSTAPYGLIDTIAVVDAAPLGAERQREDQQAREEVWQLLRDARSAGLITTNDAALMIEVHGLDPRYSEYGYHAVAARRGMSEAALRQRSSRAMRRIRAGVQDGTLAPAGQH